MPAASMLTSLVAAAAAGGSSEDTDWSEPLLKPGEIDSHGILTCCESNCLAKLHDMYITVSMLTAKQCSFAPTNNY